MVTKIKFILSPASETSREVENFDWRKKHTPVRIWCQEIHDSVCLSVPKFDPIISGLAK
jgi:hypothetical protein